MAALVGDKNPDVRHAAADALECIYHRVDLAVLVYHVVHADGPQQAELLAALARRLPDLRRQVGGSRRHKTLQPLSRIRILKP